MHHLMSFIWTPDIGDFFFKGLTINTSGSFAILCIILVILSIVYEGMKVHSASVRARAARERQRAASCAPSETANLLPPSTDRLNTIHNMKFTKKFFKLLREASVFLVHNTLGYALMLSVMIYNAYLFITVVLGMGLGYFLFGHISMKINMENIQARTTNVICSPICSDPTESASPSTSNYPTSQGHCQQLNTSKSFGSCSSTSSSSMAAPSSAAGITPVIMTENSDIIDSCRL